MSALLLSLVLFVSACSKATPASSQLPPAPTSECKLSSDDPFQCVRNRCESAGGKFNNERHLCECPSGTVFNGFDNNTCVKRSAAEPLHDSKDLARFSDDSPTQSVLIDLREEGTKIEKPLEDWLSAHGAGLAEFAKEAPRLQQSVNVHWYLGPGSFDSLSVPQILQLEDEASIVLYPAKEAASIENNFYLLQDDNWDDFLTPGQFEGKVQLPATNNGFENLAAVVNMILKTPQAFSKKTFHTADGCAGYCELRDDYPRQGFRAARITEFVAGLKFHDVIYVENELKLLVVPLLPSGQVSLIHSFLRKDSEHLGWNYQIYDRKWHSLLTNPIPRVSVQKIEDLKAHLSRFSQAFVDGPQAVVCESGFDVDTIAKIDPTRLLKGPFSEDSGTPQSFFGWLKAVPARSPLPLDQFFFSGASATDEWGIRYYGTNYGDHAEKVVGNVLSHDPELHIIPIGLDDCFVRADEWAPQVRSSSHARVVNYSALDSYTQESCAASVFGKELNAQSDFLFVVPSGNDGLSISPGDGPNMCPQSLSGLPNLVVVTSSRVNSIDWNANRGSRFADIAADATHKIEGVQSYATSFAAPNVTGVAARIFYRHPELTPVQIKKAILFGGKIPTDYSGYLNPLPVRSGGILDEAQAMNIAALYSKNPSMSDADIIGNAYSNFYSIHESYESKARKALYRNNGLLP